MRCAVALGLLALVILHPHTSSADADLLWEFSSGNWSGGAYVDESGAFSHCAIAVEYVSGISVAIGVTSDSQLQLALGNPDWQLPVSSSYQVGLLVDQRYLGRFEAMVTSPSHLLIHVGDRLDVFTRLRRGYTLTVSAAQENFAFSLAGTYNALERVRECVLLASAISPKNRNPFAASNRNPFAAAGEPEQSDPQELVQLLLLSAGVSGVQFVQPSVVDLDDAAYAWTSSDVAGAVYAIESAGASIDQTAQLVLGGMATGCEGAFASESSPSSRAGTATVKTFSAACSGAADQVVIAATAVQTEGAVLFFLNFSDANPRRVRSVNDQLASVVSTLLRQ